ncbi:hypothetical protein NDA18_000684 [Ustilago nuda]|nr:hypothetical protein NDA18_000684 [Ustilago nuda]
MNGSHPTSALQAVVSTYRKAPVTISLFASYFVSQIASKLWLDYRLFLALPGGPLPKNVFGWALHYFALFPLSLSSSWTSTRLVRAFLPKTGSGGKEDGDQLTTAAKLPRRNGANPLTAGTIPHRQLDQLHHDVEEDGVSVEVAIKEAREAVEHVQSVLRKEAESQLSHLRIGSSFVEKDSIALFAVSHTLVTGGQGVSRSTRSAWFPSSLSRRFLSSMKGELVHIHRCPNPTETEQAAGAEEGFRLGLGLDGSLHMTLHSDDAALVVEKGWGELHPLAGFPSYTGFWIGWPAWLTRLTGDSSRRSARWWSSSSVPATTDAKVVKAIGLPPTYCLVYSPRDVEEAKIVGEIVGAAMAFAVGSRPSSH